VIASPVTVVSPTLAAGNGIFSFSSFLVFIQARLSQDVLS